MQKKARIAAGYDFLFVFLCFTPHTSSLRIASRSAGNSMCVYPQWTVLGSCPMSAIRTSWMTDAYLDQALDKPMFEQRKAALVQEQRTLEDAKRDWTENRRSIPEAISRCIELAGSAWSLYQNASVEKRRLLLRTLVSNCTIRQKTLEFTWHMPFRMIATREKSDECAPSKETRLTDALIARLTQALTEYPDSTPIDM